MGWWDREVSIWRISRRSEQAPSHKLVGKVLLLGDENLSAATISANGSLLVAASFAEVKMFTLRKRTAVSEEDKYALRVHKIELPAAIAESGARLVRLSSDNKWLVVITPNSDILMARIDVESDGHDVKVNVLPSVAKLTRAPRHERHAKGKQGTHGAYERTINTVAFSSNNQIVACGDLSGCIDSWILRDVDEKSEKQQKRSDSNSSDDDSDSDSEDEDIVLGGQRWTPNPFLPRNSSNFLFITFRPQTSTESPFDKLVAVTTDHAILEFDVLKGKLSDWSRRNPKSCLPANFRSIKDRAMGALWDAHPGRERLWLYGPNWICMFDMMQDFPSPEEASQDQKSALVKSTHKRKRDDGSKPGVNTGAGDSMPLAESYVGIARKMRRVQGADAIDEQAGKWIQLREEVKPDEEEENEASLKMANMRRQITNGDDIDEDKKTDVTTNGGQNGTTAVTQLQGRNTSRKWWHTLKYREMLGILPLSGDVDDDTADTETDGDASEPEAIPQNKPTLEVAIVERPIWDVDLPGRYVRDYEE